MNDMMVYCVCLSLAVFCILSFVAFHIYRGVYDTFTSANIGDVYSFRYLQPLTGEYNRYLAKVVNVCKLDPWDIGRLNISSDYRRYDKEFIRTPTLITCEMNDGSFRQFYAERAEDCRRSIVGKLLFSAGVAHLF